MKTVVGAVIMRGEYVLAARRTTPPVGKWEFPGGKVEAGEAPRTALAREVLEELGIQIDIVAEVIDAQSPWLINAGYELRLFLAMASHDTVQPGDSHDEIRWVRINELAAVDWLPSDLMAIDAVRTAVADHAAG